MSPADSPDPRATGRDPHGSPPTSAVESPPHSSARRGEGADAEGRDPDTSVEEEEPITSEELLSELEGVIAQRDEYLALAQAKQAEFENFRKRTMKQQADELARASSKLIEALLPVIDAFDYAVAHGDESAAPLRAQLLGVLEREGLIRLDPTGEPFDPNEHDAVAHEPGDGGEPVVAETLRAGYRWQGHLLRPAMVRVKD